MPDKTGAIGSSTSTNSTWFNVHKPEVKNDEDMRKKIDIGNILNGSQACAYMS